MTTTPMGDAPNKSETIPFPDFARASEINGNMMTEAAKINAQIGNVLQHFGKEWTEFVGMRLREEMHLFQSIQTSRSMPDLQQAFVEFWQKAFTQYGDEAQRLMRISQGAMEDASRTSREIRDTVITPTDRAA